MAAHNWSLVLHEWTALKIWLCPGRFILTESVLVTQASLGEVFSLYNLPLSKHFKCRNLILDSGKERFLLKLS